MPVVIKKSSPAQRLSILLFLLAVKGLLLTQVGCASMRPWSLSNSTSVSHYSPRVFGSSSQNYTVGR